MKNAFYSRHNLDVREIEIDLNILLKYIHSSSIKLSSLMVVISLNRAQDYLRIFMSASNGNYKCGFNRNAKDAEMQFEFKRSFIFQRIENIIFSLR